MTFQMALPGDFPISDLRVLGELLAKSDIFIPGYLPPALGLYSPECFLYEHRMEGISTFILPDRNLASRIARVGMGEAVDSDRRLAAAVMAFAQCLNINFEPSIAFHELAHLQGNTIAREELGWFRAADHANPIPWLDVALERTDRLHATTSPSLATSEDLAKPLYRWNRNYALTLKIVQLELAEIRPIDKVLRLLEWMFNDFIIGGPAAIFASVYFAPASPRKRMLKHLRSPMRERAIAGAKNAAWDITHMSDFVRRVGDSRESESRYILATGDRGMARIAGLLLGREDDLSERESLANRLCDWWRPAEATLLSNALWTYIERMAEEQRQVHRSVALDYVSNLIADGERILLSWQPA